METVLVYIGIYTVAKWSIRNLVFLFNIVKDKMDDRPRMQNHNESY